MTVSKEYKESADIEFYQNAESTTTVVLNEGDFLVIYPGELHKPCCSGD